MLGYTSEEAIGQSLFDLILPPDQFEERQAIQRRLSETAVITYESLQRKKDGTLIYINSSLRTVHTASEQRA